MKHKKIIISYSSSFFKDLRKFPKNQLKFLTQKEKIFFENPFDPRLKTHKLKCELSDFYAFSISYHWRIVFPFEGENVVLMQLERTMYIGKFRFVFD